MHSCRGAHGHSFVDVRSIECVPRTHCPVPRAMVVGSYTEDRHDAQPNTHPSFSQSNVVCRTFPFLGEPKLGPSPTPNTKIPRTTGGPLDTFRLWGRKEDLHLSHMGCPAINRLPPTTHPLPHVPHRSAEQRDSGTLLRRITNASWSEITVVRYSSHLGLMASGNTDGSIQVPTAR